MSDFSDELYIDECQEMGCREKIPNHRIFCFKHSGQRITKEKLEAAVMNGCARLNLEKPHMQELTDFLCKELGL